MAEFTAVAPAKLNLALHITGKRADGYHLLETLVAFTDIGDRISVQESDGWSLEVKGPFAAYCGDAGHNLITRAAKLLAGHFGKVRPAHIVLDKQLPVGAGLGGGSSDAATVCRLLCRYWERIMPEQELAALLVRLGADLPMCLAQRPLIARGIGEILELLPRFPEVHAVLCWPGVALPTEQVYRAYQFEKRDLAIMPDISTAQTLLDSLQATRNVLQRAAIACAPEVAEALLVLETMPQQPFVRMSGSGACVVAYFADEVAAATVAEHIAARYPDWWVRQARLIGR